MLWRRGRVAGATEASAAHGLSATAVCGSVTCRKDGHERDPTGSPIVRQGRRSSLTKDCGPGRCASACADCRRHDLSGVLCVLRILAELGHVRQLDGHYLRGRSSRRHRASQARVARRTAAQPVRSPMGPVADDHPGTRRFARQLAVADYLDAETARIDALVAVRADSSRLLERNAVSLRDRGIRDARSRVVRGGDHASGRRRISDGPAEPDSRWGVNSVCGSATWSRTASSCERGAWIADMEAHAMYSRESKHPPGDVLVSRQAATRSGGVVVRRDR